MSPCATCGEPRIMIGGRPVGDSAISPLREFAVASARAPAVADVGPVLHVAERISVIDGISENRATLLRSIGIASIVDLATAEVATVASIRGVSERMATGFIREARRIVRTRGSRVLLDAGPTAPVPAPEGVRIDPIVARRFRPTSGSAKRSARARG